MSIGFVQEQPTQLDDPFYRYLQREKVVDFTVYYYGLRAGERWNDIEMGRDVGWISGHDRGYPASFWPDLGAGTFAARVVAAGHDLVLLAGYSRPQTFRTALRARLQGVPAGLRSDNVLPKDGGRTHYWGLKRLLYPKLFKLYKTAHPVGLQAEEYLRTMGFAPEALFKFPYAGDHRWFNDESTRARRDLASTRQSWRLPADGPVVSAVIKFAEREDPLTLVKAFHLARKVRHDLNLLLIGDGPLRAQVESSAGAALGTRILLPGYQKYSELPRAYAASDVFVHPARGPWEVSVNEALACGVPVITSDQVGSAKELVLPNGLGTTYPHGNAEELAKCILSVLNDPALISRARNQAMDALRDWDYPATAQRLLSAIAYARNRRH